MIGRVYGFGKAEIGKLTLTQVQNYLTQIPYVLEWSDKFGQVPSYSSAEDTGLTPEEEVDITEQIVREALCKTQQ